MEKVDNKVEGPNEASFWFRSKPMCVDFEQGQPSGYGFDGFTFQEGYLPVSDKVADGRKNCYCLQVGRRASKEADVDNAISEFQRLREELELVWHYIFGVTYTGDDFDFSDSRGGGAGWVNNRYDVLAIVNPGKLPLPEVEYRSWPVLKLREWPMNWLLRAISNARKTSETYRFLMNLHAKAMNAINIDIQLTLFGKIAEICEVLLPGSDRSDQYKKLPEGYRSRLIYDDKIFVVANTRSLTRHAMNKAKNGALHAGMKPGEAEDFRSDVDTLVRYLITEELKIPSIFYEGWRFSKAGSHRWLGRIGKERSRQRDELRKSEVGKHSIEGFQ